MRTMWSFDAGYSHKEPFDCATSKNSGSRQNGAISGKKIDLPPCGDLPACRASLFSAIAWRHCYRQPHQSPAIGLAYQAISSGTGAVFCCANSVGSLCTASLTPSAHIVGQRLPVRRSVGVLCFALPDRSNDSRSIRFQFVPSFGRQTLMGDVPGRSRTFPVLARPQFASNS